MNKIAHIKKHRNEIKRSNNNNKTFPCVECEYKAIDEWRSGQKQQKNEGNEEKKLAVVVSVTVYSGKHKHNRQEMWKRKHQRHQNNTIRKHRVKMKRKIYKNLISSMA